MLFSLHFKSTLMQIASTRQVDSTNSYAKKKSTEKKIHGDTAKVKRKSLNSISLRDLCDVDNDRRGTNVADKSNDSKRNSALNAIHKQFCLFLCLRQMSRSGKKRDTWTNSACNESELGSFDHFALHELLRKPLFQWTRKVAFTRFYDCPLLLLFFYLHWAEKR